MIIVGAGLAGLLAARMLAHHKPTVIEVQPALPNNHAAVLRFRTRQIGDLVGIPFRRVNMIKDVLPWQNPVADSLAYSFKNSGQYRSDRSVTTGLVSDERFIAPPDFIARLAAGADIRYGIKFDFGEFRVVPVISTIPMPALMKALGYEPTQTFLSVYGSVVRAKVLNCEAYVSLLVPAPNTIWSRVSLTGHELIVECPRSNISSLKSIGDIAGQAANQIGIDANDVGEASAHFQQYNKILPLADDDERKRFMYYATDKHSIYSLGRYATWRPGLLLDDLVKDIQLIDGWIKSGLYDVAKHRSK